ncbi:hypothetical protein A2U01_0082007 [Trifolium medium]|uniref:Uncharacterized protein n=1 Tax=Trifolium medium TaxID=97028 RepID=A0A392THY3_9FABA|nr:hypothetical protein [Trifolium medium]
MTLRGNEVAQVISPEVYTECQTGHRMEEWEAVECQAVTVMLGFRWKKSVVGGS